MILDNGLTFNSAVGTPQAITATADSAGIIDITGAGSGNAPAMINGYPLSNTSIGEDYGAGNGEAIPHVLVTVTTAGTGTGTIQISVEAAPDNGSYGQGTYTTLVSTQAFTGTNLTAGSVIDIPLPPVAPGEALPRFYKLTYTVSGTATVSVLANMLLNPAQVRQMTQYANNYFVV
jgi:hypothetical protein